MKYVESQTIELKEILTDGIKKEIVAFANADGGEIFVGISKSGKVTGIKDCECDMASISNMIRDGIKPDLAAYTSVERCIVGGKNVIRVTVMRGEKRPYHLSDRGLKPSGVYIRHGVTSAPASDDAIRQMIRDSDGTTFDKARSLNQDLTFDYAAKFFADCKISFSASNKRTLKLTDQDGYFTNAALLLSDQCEHSIKCAVYDGIGKTNFKARQEFTGSIIKQLHEGYQYISLNNNLNSTFDGLSRIDNPDYPEYALREALINCIVHRDYDYSGGTIVNIFEDRMEFVSIGGLVKGMTLADIMNGVSQPRNSIIADVFYRLKLIESYGTGIKRIIESYDGSIAQPDFSPAPSSFMVTLPNLNYRNRIHSHNEFMSNKEKVMRLLSEKNEISRRDVEIILGSSQLPAVMLLKELLQEGKIVKIGKARMTRYRRMG
jgi:ATP-dependent DNA helicase RecG